MGDELQALAEALLPHLNRVQANKGIGVGYGQKHDASGTPTTSGYLHGPGGLLTMPGVDPDVFHLQVTGQTMLANLPTRSSVYTNPLFQTLVGVGADSGSEMNNVCDDAPEAGIMSGCKVWAPFGRYERATVELEINRLGQRNDRGDPLDLRLVNSPMFGANVFNGQMGTASPADVLTNEVSARFWELSVSFWRLLSKQLWTGNPANNANGGGYKEFVGFDKLINTGYKDAETGLSCSQMDSDVKDFNYRRINDNGAILIDAISYIHMTRRDLAERTGLMPVRWTLAMRPNLFWEITSIWPCSYVTTGCNFGAGALANANATLNFDASDQIKMRDEMRAGRYLWVNGERLEVVLDDGIEELTGNDSSAFPRGCFSSDIYFIPMSVVGGRAVTYLEYFDFSNPSLSDAVANMGLYRVNGAFMTTVRQKNWCIQWQTKTEPRLIFRTPWLAGRLKNVVYCPTQHTVDTYPGDPYAFAAGPSTGRSGPSYYNFWS